MIDLTHTQSKPRKLKFVETAERLFNFITMLSLNNCGLLLKVVHNFQISTLQLNNSPYWITDTKFILLTSNREHTSLAVHVCFATSAVCKQVRELLPSAANIFKSSDFLTIF